MDETISDEFKFLHREWQIHGDRSSQVCWIWPRFWPFFVVNHPSSIQRVLHRSYLSDIFPVVTPQDRDEVNRRKVCTCDGWVWDRDSKGVPSTFKVIRSVVSLTRILTTFDLTWEEKWNWSLVEYTIWTPETVIKRSVSRWGCENRRHTNSLCNFPDVLDTGDIKKTTEGGLLLLRLGSELLPKRSWAMCRSTTKGTGPDTFVR